MNMKRVGKIIAPIGLGIALALLHLSAQALPASSDATTSFSKTSVNLDTVLTSIANDTHTVIVFESDDKRLKTLRSVEFSNLTASQALQTLSSIYPDYTWAKHEGGYLIFPKQGPTLLGVALKQFDVSDANVFTIADRLFKTPEVKNWLLSTSSEDGRYIAGGLLGIPNHIDIHEEDTTFGQVLIAVENKCGTYYAHVIHYGTAQRYINMNL